MLAFNPFWYSSLASPPVGPGIGIFGGGSYGTDSSGITGATNLYSFSANTWTAGVNLITAVDNQGAAGNSTLSYWVAGYPKNGAANGSTPTNVSSIYTYATNSMSSGAVLSSGSCWELAAAGNATVGVFAGGLNGSGASLNSTAYITYASNTWTPGSALNLAVNQMGGAGNATLAVFAGGQNSGTKVATSRTFTYAGATTSTGGNLTSARCFLTGFGNTTTGFFAGGYSGSAAVANTDTYTYASNTVVAGTALTYGSYAPAACGSSTVGVVAGGAASNGTQIRSTSVYTYSANTYAVGANLPTALNQFAAASTSPGNF